MNKRVGMETEEKGEERKEGKKGVLISRLLILGLGGSLLALLSDEEGVDVGHDSSIADSGLRKELVQLPVFSDGLLDVRGLDSLELLLLADVSSHFEDLAAEVLKNGSKHHWSLCADSLNATLDPHEIGDSGNAHDDVSLLLLSHSLRSLGLVSALASGLLACCHKI